MSEVSESYSKEAKRILQQNKYMVLVTSTKKGLPWGATVFFSYDKDYTFYFLSAVDSRHAKNILENHKMSFVVYNPAQQIGYSEGVQAEGEASFVDKKDLEIAIKTYSGRLFPNSKISAEMRYPPENYGETSEFRFFKIKTSKVYVTGTIDRRTEVSLDDSKE